MCKSNPTRKTYQVNCASCSTPLTAYRSYNVLCPACKKEMQLNAQRKMDAKRRKDRINAYAEKKREEGGSVVGDIVNCVDCGERFQKRSPIHVRCKGCQKERKKSKQRDNALKYRAQKGLPITVGAERSCDNCGKTFKMGRGSGGQHQRYCSKECAQNQFKIMAIKTHKKRMRTCKEYKFIYSIRQFVNSSIRRGGYTKRSRTYEILGCTWEEFKTHIERQFTKGMNWDNRGEWHLDHIVPIASANSEDEVIALNHFTNLRPIWAKENRKKGARMEFLI